MKASNKLLIASLLLSLMPTVNAASFIDKYMFDPDDGMLDASRYLSEVPLGFLPVPTIITEPATGNGLALLGVFFHESDEQKKQRITHSDNSKHFVLPSNISLVGAGATANGSKGFGFGHMGFWLKDTVSSASKKNFLAEILKALSYLSPRYFISMRKLKFSYSFECRLYDCLIWHELSP